MVLSGRLRALGGGWRSGQWSLIDREDSQSFQTAAASLDETLVSAIDQAREPARGALRTDAGGR